MFNPKPSSHLLSWVSLRAGRQDVVLTGHCDSSYADNAETHRSTQGYCFSLGSGAVSWRSTCSSSVSTSTVEAEIYAGAMAAQELRWLTFFLTDLRERPSSAPTLFNDNKATILLCREPRLESRVKHINISLEFSACFVCTLYIYLGFQPSSADPSLFVQRGSTPFFVLVYNDDLVFATADKVALADVKRELQKRHACTDLGELRHYLGPSAVQHSTVQRTPLAVDHRLTGPFPDETFESSGLYAELVGCLMSTQGYCFSLGSGAVSWRSTRSPLVSTSTAEAEIYAGAMAAQELCWLTFLLTNLCERPSFAPTLLTDNKASIFLCREPQLESRVKHINVSEQAPPLEVLSHKHTRPRQRLSLSLPDTPAMVKFNLAELMQEQLDRLMRQFEDLALEIATLTAERDSASQQSTVNTPAPGNAPANAPAQSEELIVISSGTPTQHDSMGQRSCAASDGVAQSMPGMERIRAAPSTQGPREARRHVEFATTSGNNDIMAPMPLKPQHPPCFDLSVRMCIQSWVFTMNVFFDANYVESDAAKIRYAFSLPRDPAMDSWRVIVMSPCAYEPPTQEGEPTGPAVTWSSFCETAQYSTWDACGFLALCKQVGYMHEADRVDRYVGGLKPNISHKIMLRGLSNFNEILTLAKKINILRRPGLGFYYGQHPREPAKHATVHAVAANVAAAPFKGRCFACNRPAHRKTECPEELRRRGAEQGRESQRQGSASSQ
ncbi:unnamed protein product [Closterium sp. NIES-53]